MLDKPPPSPSAALGRTASPASLHQVRMYRPFIDGLRAVAILTVVASHIALPGFAGGYVGVDIFFVISGYLIINQIIEDIEHRRFQIFDFYRRRAFRILPAFLLVMITTLFLATTVFVHPRFELFSDSFLFSAIMLANHHYLAHQDYFDMAAYTKPLLHMWSLAVEEQFYLVTPVILLVLAGAATALAPLRRRAVWIVSTLTIGAASWAACVLFTSADFNFAFYSMPTRGWEFILGGAAPYLATGIYRLPAWSKQSLSIAGAILIAAAVYGFEQNTPYPSYWATLPAVGATLIIIAGLLHPRNVVARVLAMPPMVGIGLVSYALYLWHWPLISFLRSFNLGELPLGQGLALAALSFVLAYLTYRYVEVPVRRWGKSCPFRSVTVVAVSVASCIALAAGGWFFSHNIAPLTLPKLTGLGEWSPRGEPTVTTSPGNLPGNDPPIAHRGILLGDSVADQIGRLFPAYARHAGARLDVLAKPACLLLLNASVLDDRGRLQTFCEPYRRQIDFHGLEFAVLMDRWNLYLALPQLEPYRRSIRVVDAGATDAHRDPYEVLAQHLAETITAAKAAGVQRVLVMAPLPEFPWYPPYCIIRAIRFRLGSEACTISRTGVDERRSRTLTVLREVTARFDGVRLLDPIGLFCTNTECKPNDGNLVFFHDMGHLSPAGIELLYTTYQGDFLWAFTGDAGAR